MSKETHTLREKGQALFLAALMVLSVFAMSAAFAGGAAADATDVEVADVDLASESAATIDVTHTDGDSNVYAVIDVDDDGTYTDGDILVSETTASGTSTTLTANDLSALDVDGTYDVYAFSGTDDSVEPTTGTTDLTSNPSDDFTVSDSTPSDLTITVDDGEEAVSGADVTIDGQTQTTDNNGEVTFSLPSGDYEATVNADYYDEATQTVTNEDGSTATTISLTESEISQSTVFQGEEVTANVPSDVAVELRSGDDDDNSFVRQLNNDDGTVTINTDELDGDYILRIDGDDNANYQFEVAEQTLDAQWSSDSVVRGDSADLELDSNREGYDVELTSEELDATEIQSLFGDDVVTVGTDEDDNDVAQVEDVSSSESLTANFADDADLGNVSITASATDTTAEDNATITVEEEPDASAQFDPSTYSEEAGDIVAFTVDLQNAESATVDLMEDNENYEATVEVTDNDDDGEVTVYFNTFNAGQNGDTFYTADDSDDTVSVSGETDLGSDYRLLPSDFNLELNVNEEETDVATLVLNERSTGDVSTGVAPADSDLSDVDDLNNATTESSEVALGDQVVVGVDVSGVFGHLDGMTDEEIVTELTDESTGFLNLEIEVPSPYDSGNEINSFDVVQDEEENRIYFVIDTTENDIEAGDEYDVTFGANGDYVDYYSDSDDNDAEESTTSFEVVERTLEITGADDDETLEIGNGEEANVTGESNAAPGTSIDVRLRATGDNPFIMTQAAEVQDDGTVDADFDLSDAEEGQNLTVRMTDTHGIEEIQTEADATIVEDAGQPHSVTITVEDADGNAVSGADVSVADQTETTDDDGQVTFELWHGEYDVTATHDGEETTGTLTINDEDDTTDEGTLVLGEENQNINDGDDQNQDDNNQDDNNQDDNNNDGSGDDSEGEDQPGFGIAVALIALLAAAGIALRNRA